MQHFPMAGRGDKRFRWRTFRSVLRWRRDGVRPVRLQGEPKWPGKHRRLSKFRLAWKSTCMPAPPAS